MQRSTITFIYLVSVDITPNRGRDRPDVKIDTKDGEGQLR